MRNPENHRDFCESCKRRGHDNTNQKIHEPNEVCPNLLMIQLEDIVDTLKNEPRREGQAGWWVGS